MGQRFELGIGLSLNHIQVKDSNYTFWVKLPAGDERVVPLYEMNVEQDIDGFFDALFLGKFVKLTYMGPKSTISRVSYFVVAHFQRNPSLSVNYRINFSQPSVGSFSPGMNYVGLGMNYRLNSN